ncbi:glycoside hydrolase superfamily [Cladochytrium replicatum]|nr:glycoside hydrolase superfamily [Cladochytrium replicatum]
MASNQTVLPFLVRNGSVWWDPSTNAPFRFFSFNIPNLFMIEDDSWRLPDTWEQEDALKSLSLMGPGARLTRTYCLSVETGLDFKDYLRHVRITKPLNRTVTTVQGASKPLYLDEEAFVALDNALAIASRYKIYVMIPIIDRWEWWGGIGSFARLFNGTSSTNESIDDAGARFFKDRTVRDGFKAFVTAVMNRNNTVTGKKYYEDPTIIWETGNELSMPSGDRVPSDWTLEITSMIKGISKGKQLVVDGSYGKFGWDDRVLTDANIDAYTDHLYIEVPATETLVGYGSLLVFALVAIVIAIVAVAFPKKLLWNRTRSGNHSSDIKLEDLNDEQAQGKAGKRRCCGEFLSSKVAIITAVVCTVVAAVFIGVFANYAITYLTDPPYTDRCVESSNKVIGSYQKPFFIGETLGPVTTTLNRLAQTTVADGANIKSLTPVQKASGVMMWSLRYHSSKGGFYTHKEFDDFWSFQFPGLPANVANGFAADSISMINLVRNAAASIYNQAQNVVGNSASVDVPVPLPTPDPPTILSVKSNLTAVAGSLHVNVTMRGSTGAQYYTILRASNDDIATAPSTESFSTVASSVYENGGVESPIFTDKVQTSAKVLWYRAIAHNVPIPGSTNVQSSGASAAVSIKLA